MLYINLTQRVWWRSSIIGLQYGLVIHINNVRIPSYIVESNPVQDSSIDQDNSVTPEQELSGPSQFVHPSRLNQIQTSNGDFVSSENESVSTTETDIHNRIIENCDLFLEQSKQERKAVGRKTRQISRVVKQEAKKQKYIKTFSTPTEGIDRSELLLRKAAGECQRGAWPQDSKGSHKTLDCLRWKR